ncbi:odorant receptor 43a-like isoform X2 [Leptopilina heterotoma]|uniref:odorant receptor 43a-like isoform X2 n=1 Tax=Leptopilina heterotoma TaxID=63436 RepID=UPI001CA936BB|nr:odorant receptor 43a-like isoform X2 [Leptopilina heterotoma]
MYDSKKREIYIGQISYTLFQICGIWKPLQCHSQWKLRIYYFYSIFTLTLYFLSTFLLFIYMFQIHEDVKSFTQSVFYFSTYFNVLMKLSMLVIRREVFIKSNTMLLSDMCRSRDNYEADIINKCSEIGRRSTIRFLIFVHITPITMLLVPLTSDKRRALPHELWLPFTLEVKFVYILIYLYQAMCLIMILYISVGMESLALTVMQQICGQLEIIKYRLSLLPKLVENNKYKPVKYSHEEGIVKHCIKSHLYIYSLGENINKQFGLIIFTQFFASMVNMCAIIYNMASVSPTNRMFWIMIASVGSYILQIFIYCFYGDKMTEKSSEIGSAIYTLDWEALTVNTQKSLIIIMIRSTKPIKLTASSIIIMSIETFMKIMKSAYTAYNVLK